ncbi:cobyrinate a,c-diamide synthase [Thermosulfuriphilus sp.]
MKRPQARIPRLTISALKGGAGKTLITLGILHGLRLKGLKVIPFKKGPDYIDAGWLGLVAGGNCYNLDPFMMDASAILDSFGKRIPGADLALVEGNRGLFDGADVEGSCSTAELAKRLASPIILVLDCTKVTRTIAAQVLGCLHFAPDLAIRGVILNRIARSRHERIVRESIEKYCDLPVLGVVPRVGNFLPMRHLGLLPWQEYEERSRVLKILEEKVLANIDLEAILALAREVHPVSIPEVDSPPNSSFKVKIGIFRDAAFQFYYPENLEALESCGAELIFINALEDSRLPDIDALYIGGGFPETQAEFLESNQALRQDLREAIDDGLPVYAECGGLMYLGQRIIYQGRSFEMVGALGLDFEVCPRPQGHGYVIVRVENENPFYPKGLEIIGHEFHYSRPRGEAGLNFAFRVLRGYGVDGFHDGIIYRNVLGTYTHIHALGCPLWAPAICRLAEEYHLYKAGLRTKAPLWLSYGVSKKEVEV